MGCVNGVRLLYGTWYMVFSVFASFSVTNLDLLATSTSVERLFLHGGAQVGKHRHKLKFETLRCLMVLRSWFGEGLVPEGKVMEMFRDLRTQRRAGDDDMDV